MDLFMHHDHCEEDSLCSELCHPVSFCIKWNIILMWPLGCRLCPFTRTLILKMNEREEWVKSENNIFVFVYSKPTWKHLVGAMLSIHFLLTAFKLKEIPLSVESDHAWYCFPPYNLWCFILFVLLVLALNIEAHNPRKHKMKLYSASTSFVNLSFFT